MLTFDQNGFLTPCEAILTDFSTVERVFVDEFPSSTTRRAHFDRYLDYNACLSTYLPDGFTQWVDGSFVTRKKNPDDIDVLTFVDYALFERHEQALRGLKKEFAPQVDSYYVPVYPIGHRNRIHYDFDYIDWLHTWGYTTIRPRSPKGFIELKTI